MRKSRLATLEIPSRILLRPPVRYSQVEDFLRRVRGDSCRLMRWLYPGWSEQTESRSAHRCRANPAACESFPAGLEQHAPEALKHSQLRLRLRARQLPAKTIPHH